MDEQDMDVFEHDHEIDLDAAEAMPGGRSRQARMDEMRRRASKRMDEAQRRALNVPVKVVSGVVGALPVQTREASAAGRAGERAGGAVVRRCDQFGGLDGG